MFCKYSVMTSKNSQAQSHFHACICVTLTHWGRDNMAAISQTTLSNAFSWKKMLEFRLKFHWSLFIRVQWTIFQHWFRCLDGAKPLSESMVGTLLTHICVTRPQWVNSLAPGRRGCNFGSVNFKPISGIDTLSAESQRTPLVVGQHWFR